MTFDEIKAAIVGLGDQDKTRVVTELLPAIWTQIVCDEPCLEFLRKIVDEEAVKK